MDGLQIRRPTPAMLEFMDKLQTLTTALLEERGRMPLREIVVDEDFGIALGMLSGERTIVHLEAGLLVIRSVR